MGIILGGNNFTQKGKENEADPGIREAAWWLNATIASQDTTIMDPMSQGKKGKYMLANTRVQVTSLKCYVKFGYDGFKKESCKYNKSHIV